MAYKGLAALIAQVQALDEKASKAPWTKDAQYFVAEVQGGRPGGEVIGQCTPTASSLRGTTPDFANAELIAVYRSAAPVLAAALKDAFEREDKIDSACEALSDEDAAFIRSFLERHKEETP